MLSLSSGSQLPSADLFYSVLFCVCGVYHVLFDYSNRLCDLCVCMCICVCDDVSFNYDFTFKSVDMYYNSVCTFKLDILIKNHPLLLCSYSSIEILRKIQIIVFILCKSSELINF